VSGQVSGDNSVPWYNPKIAEKELDVKVYVHVGKPQKYCQLIYNFKPV